MTRALLTLALLVPAACGGGADGPDGGAETAATPTGPAEPPPPEPHDPRLDEALARIARGELDGAAELAGRVAAERPRSARAAFLLGLALHKRKNYGAALPHFDRALELGPTFEPFAPVHYFRGWCLYNLGAVEEARAAFEAHLSFEPGEADSRFALGLIALDQGRLDEAERRLEAALADALAAIEAGDDGRRADAAKARARLADVHLARAGRPRAEALRAARAELEAAVELYPPHYTTWYKLYSVLVELGEDELAERALAAHDLWKARVRPGSAGLGGG